MLMQKTIFIQKNHLIGYIQLRKVATSGEVAQKIMKKWSK